MVDPIDKRVQFPGDVTGVVDEYTGPARQLVIDTARNELRLQDGFRKGGWRFPNFEQLRRLFLASDSEFGKVIFPAESVGFLARTGNRIYRLRNILGGDGITVDNAAGTADSPRIRLPDRLKETHVAIDSADDAVATGFYIVTKGTDTLPLEIRSQSDAMMIVVAYEGGGGAITQIITTAVTQINKIFIRHKIGIVWLDWLEISTIPGDRTSLIEGVDETYRVWRAEDIAALVRNVAGSIQYIDGGGAAKAFSMNSLFLKEGEGDGGLQATHGPFTVATNDRFEIVASASTRTLPGGDTRTATVEIEVGAVWTIIATETLVVGADELPQDVVTTARVVITAAGYQLTDENWSVLSTVAGGVPTGRFRVTHGALGRAGSRGSRWR